MSEITTPNEDINQEIELIQSIYEEACKISYQADQSLVTFKMTITPQTAGDVSCQYSLFDIVVKCSMKYPCESRAEVCIAKSAGLTDQTSKQLLSELSEITKEHLEDEAICVFQIFDHCSEFITEHNIPETECSICLDLLDESIIRTDCYHFFHIECLAEYIENEKKSKNEAAKDNNANLKINFDEFLCPDCREPLSKSVLEKLPKTAIKNENATNSAVLNQQVSLDDETKEYIQKNKERMEKLLKIQQDNDGLITEKKEKVFCISAPTVRTDQDEADVVVESTLENESEQAGPSSQTKPQNIQSSSSNNNFTEFQKLSDSDISIIKNLHFYNSDNPPLFDSSPKNWTRKTWEFSYKQFFLAKNQSNQRLNKLTESQIQKNFKSKFENFEFGKVHIPKETFNQVIFTNFDFRKLRNFVKNPAKEKNLIDNLHKPVELWSNRELNKVQKMFGDEFDVISSLKSGKMMKKKVNSSSNSNSNYSSNTNSKQSSSATRNRSDDKLYDKDIRALQNLKYMHKANDIQWGKIYFKNDPKHWSERMKQQGLEMLEDAELVKNFCTYFSII